MTLFRQKFVAYMLTSCARGAAYESFSQTGSYELASLRLFGTSVIGTMSSISIPDWPSKSLNANLEAVEIE